jgi:hypothetical protein
MRFPELDTVSASVISLSLDKVDNAFKEGKLKGAVEHLSVARSDDYGDWMGIIWALVRIYKKEEFRRQFCYEIVTLFSKRSKKYDVYQVDDVFDKAWDDYDTEAAHGGQVRSTPRLER